MNRKLVRIAVTAIIVAIIITTFAPVLIMAARKLTVETSSKCDSLGGQYSSEFSGPAHCFRIIDGELVDSFDEVPNATK